MEDRTTIAICDQKPEHIAEIEKALEIALFSRCEYLIDVFMDGRTLLQAVSENTARYDMLLLETDIKAATGMALARALRQKGCKSTIIFITENRDYVFDAYTVGAFDYLVKPVSLSRLSKTINRYFDTKFEAESVFSFKTGKDVRRVPFQDIMLLVSNGRKIRILLQGGEDSYYGKMDEALSSLPEEIFLRPHQSYTVNIRYIQKYSRDSITLYGGQSVPISRQRLEETMHRLQKAFSSAI